MPSQANTALPPGFMLDQYRIERQLSLGGFSIVYLARAADGMPVAIKEYLPNALALRSEGQIEPVVTGENLAAFRYGMKCFFEEGRALARLMHPNVVRVLNFFRANGTVYMVMDFVRGRTLHEFIHRQREDMSERFVRGVFTRLLNGLREVHARKLLHLDIKPSNIYLRQDGTPVLLDFGAARQTLMMSGERYLKPMYTPGFASPEQYGGREGLGPWSDIYSIGASIYSCITAAPPPRADERVKKDTYEPLATSADGRFSPHLRELVDWCLQLDPLARPQSVYALQKALAEPVGPAAQPSIAPNTSWLNELGGKLKGFIGRS